MSANHSDCRYAIRGDRVPVTGTRYTTYFLIWSKPTNVAISPITFQRTESIRILKVRIKYCMHGVIRGVIGWCDAGEIIAPFSRKNQSEISMREKAAKNILHEFPP